MPNRLAQCNSPYLLQHQNNPVQWYPWGDEALEISRSTGKPIFLSIGYSACHWCHVMEHESFEDQRIASLLNEHFVSIKVDREERPDLDQIYMQAVQLMTGSGGWPMNVFLAPDLRPFYGGTYWPPTSRWGRPGFDQVLRAVTEAWQNRREDLLKQAAELSAQVSATLDAGVLAADADFDRDWLDKASSWLLDHADMQHGGFGSAPKFPHTMDLSLLLQLWREDHDDRKLQVVTLALDKMADGGIYDHLGGGFARYSVDERWLVPHFEKMLYDNALLIALYVEAYAATGHEKYRSVVCDSLEYVFRDMTLPEGAFCSSEDADSEGEEGKFYTWSREEIVRVLERERGELFCEVYDVTSSGNFEGRSVLNLPQSLEKIAEEKGLKVEEICDLLASPRRELLQERGKRVRPGRDDKVLVSWNALMIDAMARAHQIFGEERYLSGAKQAAEFIFNYMRQEDGRLWHTWRQGQASLGAYLDDYAYLVHALLTLYESDFDLRWMIWAEELLRILKERFGATDGGFYFTSDDHEQLITRCKDQHDSSVPSGNAMAALALIRFARLTGEESWRRIAEGTLRSLAPWMKRAPQAAGQSLRSLDLWLGHFQQWMVLGDLQSSDSREWLAAFRRVANPRWVIAWKDTRCAATGNDALSEKYSIWKGKEGGVGSQLVVYRCEAGVCNRPAYGLREALQQLEMAQGVN